MIAKNSKTQAIFKISKTSTAKFNRVSNKFVCSKCNCEMDGQKAKIEPQAMVDGKMEKDVCILTCKCGLTHMIAASETAKAQLFLDQQAAIVRLNELKAIYKAHRAVLAKSAQKLSLKNQWNREFSARFSLVYSS